MTPEQHNKYLGLSHLSYAAFQLMMGLVFGAFFLFMFTSIPDRGPDPPPAFMGVFFGLFFFGFYGLMTVPSIVAGIALLKQKRWAKIAAIIGGVLSGMQFPIGTAVCIYTFWFLFSDPGKALYDRPSNLLP